MRSLEQAFSSAKTGNEKKDHWATPLDVFDPLHAEFGFVLDAAALSGNTRVPNYYGPDHIFPSHRDGVAAPWTAPTWCNPPYSNAIRFIGKAQSEAHTHGVVSVCLVFARTDTGWWWRHVLGRDPTTRERLPDVTCAAELRWRPGRIRFLDPDTKKPRVGVKGVVQAAPTPSVAVVFRGRNLAEWPTNGVL